MYTHVTRKKPEGGSDIYHHYLQRLLEEGKERHKQSTASQDVKS